MRVDDSIKLCLLLNSLRITCRYFKGDEEICGASEYGSDTFDGEGHVACNCDGNIDRCDLPEKFHRNLLWLTTEPY